MEYKWRALGVVSIGSLMAAIDGSVLVIAFPTVARDLAANLVDMVWVLMIYLLFGTALVLSLGRISDLKGRKRLYNLGFVVFVIGSALCGLAQTGWQLVAFRGVQGVGGAMLIANSFAILSDAFPPNERGRALGINSVVWGSGAVFGILLGGLILTVTSWRWIFWINVPIGIAATVMAHYQLRESVTPNARETFDLPAALLFISALGSFLLGITDEILYGISDPWTVGPLLAAVPFLVGFLVWERRISHDPILPFGLFRSWLLRASLATSVLQGLAIMATNFLLMIYFQWILGVPVLTAAYLLIPISVALAVVGPFGGRLSDLYGARIVSTIGLVIQASALLLFSSIDRSTPLGWVAGYEALMGVGGGLFFPANTSAIMAGLPRQRYGVGAGVMMTLRNSAMALSFAVSLIALTSQLPGSTSAQLFGGGLGPAGSSGGLALLEQQFLRGMSLAFKVAASLVIVAAVFSVLRGREYRRGEIEAGRVASVREPAGPTMGPPRPSDTASASPTSSQS